jgi:hypothetical protein
MLIVVYKGHIKHHLSADWLSNMLSFPSHTFIIHNLQQMYMFNKYWLVNELCPVA